MFVKRLMVPGLIMLPAPDVKLKEMVLSRALDIFEIVRRSPHGEEVISSLKPAIMKSLGWFYKEQHKLFEQVVREGCEKGYFREREPRIVADVLTTLSALLTPPFHRFKTKRELRNFIAHLM